MQKPRIGIWIDDPVSRVLTARYWDTLVDHGISTAAVMLEGYEGGFDAKYNEATLERLKTFALARDVEVVLTTWPEPNKKYMQDFESRIESYLKASGAAGLEYDAEGNWLPRRVKGYPNIDVAGDDLVKVVENIARKYDVRSELTTYPYHTENNRRADVAPHMDRLLPQAYSVRNRESGPIAWDSQFGPGGMQKLTLDRAKQIKGPKLSCGLAAYDQVWPGKTGRDAMEVAYEAACNYELEEIRYWSSKWVLGIRKNSYSSDFLKSLAK
ncbi:hypothetical protein HC928_03645 [bacterium]|nr:hypothetical protein [bacterium]